MSVQTAKTPEAPLGHTETLQIRKHDLAGIADDDPFDFALTVDQDADLPPYLPRDLGYLPGEVMGDELTCRDSALVELLQPLALLSLQARDVAFELVNVAASLPDYWLWLSVSLVRRSSLARADR